MSARGGSRATDELRRESPPGGARVAVDIGATHVRVAVVDGAAIMESHVRRAGSFEMHPNLGIIPVLEEMLDAVIASRPHLADGGIGIGVAGIVDDAGALREALSLGLPGGSALKDRLERRYRAHVVIDNDANMAALGEFAFGAARGLRNFVLVTLGTNIGMGTMVDGRVYRGATGAAGEVGTIPVRLAGPLESIAAESPDESVPPHGFAWAEDVYGGRAMLAQYVARHEDADEPLVEGHPRVLRRAAGGDAIAVDIVERTLDGWAHTIAAVCGVLDPSAVLLGGGMATDLEPHLPDLRRRVERTLPATPPVIEIAQLGENAGLIGAAAAAAAIGALVKVV